MRAGVKASRARHPEKNRARAILQDAIRRGLIRRGPCYAAGPDCRGGIEGHHDDYNKPLDPTWTCRRHHRALDRKRRLVEQSARRILRQQAADLMSLLEFAQLVPKGSTIKPTAPNAPPAPAPQPIGGQP